MPLGVFVVVHVLVQATALAGPGRYARVVGGLARLPVTRVVELLFVALPLAFHAIYGLVHVVRPPPDAEAFGYRRPRLDRLMRITSVVVLVFVLGHAAGLRGAATEALHSTLSAHLSTTTWGVPVVALGYVVGLAAVSFHLAYGCWAVLVATDRAGRRAAAASIAGGALLFTIGTSTVIALSAGGTIFADEDPASAVPCGPASR